MKNLKFFVSILITTLATTTIYAETMYVISGKCNVPLTAGMNSAAYQIFTWDGTNATKTTDITCTPNGAASAYYNSTSLSLDDIKKASNYSTGSSSNRTMQAIKVAGGNKLTVSVGSKSMSKIIVVVRPASGDQLSLDVLGETISSKSNSNFYVVEKEQNFTGDILIADNTTSKEYHFFLYMIEGPAVPAVAVTGVSVQPTTLNLEAGNTSTLTATVLPDNASNKKISWSSNDPAVASVSDAGVVKGESAGTTKIIVTTDDGGKTAECTVTVSAAAPVPVTSISLADQTVQEGSSASTTITYTPSNANSGKQCNWTSSDNSIATVNNGTVTGVKEGTVTITATSTTDSNIKATCKVTVTAASPIPQTNLTCHEPGIYEEKTVAGGYGGTLSVVGGREYETYYASFLESGALSVTITPVQKSEGITTSISTYNCKAKDGWMEMKTSTSKSNYTMSAIEEFKGGEAATHKLLNNAYYKMHVSGFDQFSFYGKDNTADESKGKHFEVYIDNIKQSMTTATSASIRRFDMTSGEHLIEVRGVGASNNEFYAFSLRVSDQPRTRWIKGNDSTQTILQTQAPKAVYYYTKYNSKGETKLEWDGAEATGISLSVKGSTDIGDTLVLGGVANCPTGDYKYNVVTYMNGQETSRASGKFKVMSDIKVKSESTTVDAYQQEEMEEIEFRYYALDASAITLSWENDNAPAGITTSDDATEHIFTISGTPTAPQGDYPFSVTIAGSETVITGVIKVWSSDLGENPVLYLYKTKGEKSAYDNDGIYEYLKSKDVNLIPRTAIKKLRSADQYAKFKWILISEDVDADNEEVLEIIKGGSGLPVLNLKGFTYTADRLGWGEPDNGTLDTISNNGCNIFIEREDHPIFESFNLKHGAKLQIFNKLQPNSNGVMPINIDLPGSLCLATAYTRNIEYYYQDGELQTVIHEIPADQREGKKYICVPLAMSNSKNLSADGKKLFNEIVKYLMDDTEYPVSQRTLKINSFRVNNLDATIKEDRIDLVYDTIQHPEMNIKALAPEIALEDELTHVTPASGDTIDFTYSLYMPVVYVVTDFINRHVYEVVIQAYGSQGLEEITYTVGEWVNIYDIYGRLIATTNENIHTMNLPRGMYIAVTENGKSIKLMK